MVALSQYGWQQFNIGTHFFKNHAYAQITYVGTYAGKLGEKNWPFDTK
jgi:hypothetical protein